MDPESRESSLNGDGDKQVLAPAEGPRESLISTAVKFLQNPKVMSSPLYQKKAFLEKKGLTQEEISIAVERSGVKDTHAEIVPNQPGPPAGYQLGVMGAPNTMAGPVYAPMPPQSIWAKARDLTMTTVIVAGVSYALYQLFEKYLRPLLFGRSVQEKRMEKLESQILEIQKSVADSLAEMTRTLSGIQMSIQTQPQPAYSFGGNEKALTDLKADVASLKGLLLSRSQFPPAPATSMVLPSWQRASASTVSTPVTSKSATATSGPIEILPDTLSENQSSGKDLESSAAPASASDSEARIGSDAISAHSTEASQESASSGAVENREDMTSSDPSTDASHSKQDKVTEPGQQFEEIDASSPDASR